MKFYKPFSKEVAKAEEEMEKIQIKDEPAGFDCEVCGSPMVIKLGRFGKFYACSNFPDCRHTQAIVKKSVLSVQVVIRDKSLSVKQSVTASSMVATAIQNVNLPLGISLLVVTVQMWQLPHGEKSPRWWQAGCL